MTTNYILKDMERSSLGIVDVSGLASPDRSDRTEVAAELRAACLQKGFLYIVGHGVDESLQRAVFEQAKAFFDLDPADKAQVDKSISFCNRGYEPLRGQTLEAGAPPDLKEGYYIGVDLPLDDPRVAARRFNRGPNQWPETVPDFRPVMTAYFDQMLGLSRRLMEALAQSLSLPETHFDEFLREPLALLRLLHYPPQPAEASPREKGAGAHTDFGAMTMLMQDDNGGLQVFDKDADAWIRAEPMAGAYVVNLGDLIARWTNGAYSSTLHRVVNESGRERYSVPFFLHGNPDAVIEPLPGCVGPDNPARHPTTTVEGHLQEMYRRTYATM